jgi:aspartyl aminopeptidase
MDPTAEAFSFNRETQLLPICGLVTSELQGEQSGGDDGKDSGFEPFQSTAERHHPQFINLLARELSVDAKDIIDFELLLYDTQKSCLGGLNDEFIFGSRLDNLVMSFCATEALIRSVSDENALDDESVIRMAAHFDHEEIGSKTAQGADSNVLPSIIRRLSLLHTDPAVNPQGVADYNNNDLSTVYEQSLAGSFLISADMAHSVHPNYGSKHESDHRPLLNKGVVIKVNANARYATSSPGIVLLREVARKAASNSVGSAENKGPANGVPLQLFVVRNDSNCGSTIGPFLSALLGARTVDLGNPQLSMHSIRETAGTKDVEYAVRLFAHFYKHYSTLGPRILVD